MSDQRTRNRLREHSREGHELSWTGRTATYATAAVPVGAQDFRCPCGWQGWLWGTELDKADIVR